MLVYSYMIDMLTIVEATNLKDSILQSIIKKKTYLFIVFDAVLVQIGQLKDVGVETINI